MATYETFDNIDPVLLMDTPFVSSGKQISLIDDTVFGINHSMSDYKNIALPTAAFNPNGYAFPITELANEVVHMIFAYLTPRETANLRFLSKNMAVVGLHYLVPTVHLDLEEDSFKKLRDIADHPVVSKHVYELVYEVDHLELLSWEDWSRRIMGPEYIASRNRGEPEHPGVNASVAAMQVYLRELETYSSMPAHQFSQEEIHQEWNQFRDAYIKQSNICHSRSLSRKLRDALVRLPKLRYVHTSSKNTMTRWIEGFTQRLGASWDEYALVLNPPRGASKVGLCSTQNVLRALGRHNLPITTLCLDGLNWQFLAQDKRDFIITKESFRHLKNLSMEFINRITEREGRISVNANRYHRDGFKQTQQRGRFLELLSAAPDLEALRISFNRYYPTIGMSLGVFHWTSLKAVELDTLETSERDLIDFFSRHANSLHSVTLTDIDLLDGTWFPILHKMRQTLKLKHAHAFFELSEDDGMTVWEMDRTIECWNVERKVSVVSPPLGELIGEYLQEYDKEDMTFEAYLINVRFEPLGVPLLL